MKGRIWTVVVAIASIAALIAVPAALAAYTSPKLEVKQVGTVTTIKASLNPNDDPTARVSIFAPTGTQLTTNQAPGTVLGPVKAIVKALDLAGADLPLEGQLVVAAPGQVPAATQAACISVLTGGNAPLATWLMVLSAAGQTLTVPTYLVEARTTIAGVLPAVVVCLPPPDVPVGTPGRATFGAKVYSAELSINGVFSTVPVGAWVGFWIPYTPLVGAANPTGIVASPAQIAPGAVSVKAKKLGMGALVTGAVTQAGQPRSGAVVTIWGAKGKAALKPLGRAKVSATGAFTFRAKAGDNFQARAIAAPGSAAAVCAQFDFGTIPCVNPTVNGFTAKSAVVKKK